MQLKIMTYNIRHCRGVDNIVDIDRITTVIQESQADIVCLQEVDRGLPRSSFHHQVERIASNTDFHFAFHANFGVPFAGMGNAILSRYRIHSTWNKMLPSSGEPRSLICTTVNSPLGQIFVGCTHFGLTQSQRLLQAQMVAGIISKQALPSIVSGDFNAVKASDEMKYLLQETDLVDCGPDPGYTFTSSLPVVKIDFILASPHFKIINSEIWKSDGSDHFPVAATVELS